jgi:urease accessory protein
VGETTRIPDRVVRLPRVIPDPWVTEVADLYGPCSGRLALTFARSAQRTIVADVYSEGMLKSSPPLYLTNDGAATCYLIHLGGGGVAGDVYCTWLDLKAGSRVLLTPQAATKVFRSRHAPVVQTTYVHLEVTEVEMAQGATLLWTDMFTPGWAPDARPYSYDEIRSKLVVRVAGELVLFDHVRLGEPPEQCLDGSWPHGIGRLEGYSHYGSMLAMNPRLDATFLDQLWETMAPYASQCRIGLSALRVPGFVVRVLAPSTPALESLFGIVRSLVYEQLFGHQPASLRKL